MDSIEAGEDVNALNEWNNNPIAAASNVQIGEYAYIRNIEMIRILLTHPMSRKKIDVKGLLWCSMESDSLDIFNLIYCFGGDIHIKYEDGRSLLVIASSHGCKKIGVHLINLGADVDYAKKYLEDKVEICRADINKFQDNDEVIPAWTEKNFQRSVKNLRNLNEIINSHKIYMLQNPSVVKI